MELELELDFSGGVISVRKVKVDTDSIPGSVSDPDEAWPGILYAVDQRKLHLTNMVLSIVEDLNDNMQGAAHGDSELEFPPYPWDETDLHD